MELRKDEQSSELRPAVKSPSRTSLKNALKNMIGLDSDNVTVVLSIDLESPKFDKQWEGRGMWEEDKAGGTARSVYSTSALTPQWRRIISMELLHLDIPQSQVLDHREKEISAQEQINRISLIKFFHPPLHHKRDCVNLFLASEGQFSPQKRHPQPGDLKPPSSIASQRPEVGAFPGGQWSALGGFSAALGCRALPGTRSRGLPPPQPSPGAGGRAAPLTSLIVAARRGARGAARAGEARRGALGAARATAKSCRAPRQGPRLTSGGELVRRAGAAMPAPRLSALSFPPGVSLRPGPVRGPPRASSCPTFYSQLVLL
ncbi:hypothetical protein HPG69_006093 [Diceros bicornis minor]|uniref:Uncharacterized protein n=1 Tax=Diceros bicornis minor TaxID=77932 RepID=A0A7J7ER84_DICBM|nr:hypothetical protein HPG69_006093 [Diceros bicornis minor]